MADPNSTICGCVVLSSDGLAIAAAEPECGDCSGTGEVCRICEARTPDHDGMCERCERTYAVELADAIAERMHQQAAALLRTIEETAKRDVADFTALRATVSKAIAGLAELAR